LYDAQPEIRLMQELVLGIAGWRVLKTLDIPVEICHINEGHAAFVVLERALDYMKENRVNFQVALSATRAANVFTTHTPVVAGFDTYHPHLVARYLNSRIQAAGMTTDEFLSMGRWDPQNTDEDFNMAIFATRGSADINGVSRLHQHVSRRIFQPLYPSWPEHEVPVSHITNGIHLPTWTSKLCDDLLSGLDKDYWQGTGEQLPDLIKSIPDEELWKLRTESKKILIGYVQHCIARHFKQFMAGPLAEEQARNILDPDVLTIGFARRFTAYKRPNLLLFDEERLEHILTDPVRPVQLIAAGKAHPNDEEGIRLIQQFINFARKAAVRPLVVFLPDYDIALAQHLVRGVDVWINTPRRPWEACGTSGMKVLINGGLNLSELDGWWAEAYFSTAGLHIGDSYEHTDPGWDAVEATQLYETLEKAVIPEYYIRDCRGLPAAWINRIRGSMSELAPKFSSNRMLRDYIRKIYIPATLRLVDRTADNSRLAIELVEWQTLINKHWHEIRFGTIQVTEQHQHWHFEAQVYLRNLKPDQISIEMFADPVDGHSKTILTLDQIEGPCGDENIYIYRGTLAAHRPKHHFAIRVIPFHPAARVPLENNHILWKYPLAG
jgi:starch phosphorylase